MKYLHYWKLKIAMFHYIMIPAFITQRLIVGCSTVEISTVSYLLNPLLYHSPHLARTYYSFFIIATLMLFDMKRLTQIEDTLRLPKRHRIPQMHDLRVLKHGLAGTGTILRNDGSDAP